MPRNRSGSLQEGCSKPSMWVNTRCKSELRGTGDERQEIHFLKTIRCKKKKSKRTRLGQTLTVLNKESCAHLKA